VIQLFCGRKCLTGAAFVLVQEKSTFCSTFRCTVWQIMIFFGLEKGHNQSWYIFQYHQKQNTKIFREEQSRAWNPAPCTTPTQPPNTPQKNYIQKTSYICPHRIKLTATPLIFPRILPSKQTKYLAKLVDFLLY